MKELHLHFEHHFHGGKCTQTRPGKDRKKNFKI